MGTKKKATKAAAPALPPPDDDDDLPPVEPAAELIEPDGDADAELADALADLASVTGATITVNRVNDQGREELIDRFPAREFDLFSIRDRFGAGTYVLYGRDGKKLKHKGRVIFGRSIEEQRAAGGRPGALGAVAPPLDPLGSMRELFDRQAKDMRDLLSQMIQLAVANRPAPMDPMTVIDAATKLANLNKRDSGGLDNLEQLARFHKLVRDIGGGEGGGGDASGLVELGKEAFRAWREAAPPPTQPAAPHQLTGESQMMILLRRVLAERVPVLIRAAQLSSDPGVYAQLVLDQTPELYLDQLVEHLKKDNWFDVLVQVDGRVVPLQAWFEQLRTEILQATQQPPPTEA